MTTRNNRDNTHDAFYLDALERNRAAMARDRAVNRLRNPHVEIRPAQDDWLAQIEIAPVFDGDLLEDSGHSYAALDPAVHSTRVIKGRKRLSAWMHDRNKQLKTMNKLLEQGQSHAEITADGYVRMWMKYYRIIFDVVTQRYATVKPKRGVYT